MIPKDVITPNRSKIQQKWKIATFDIETIPNSNGESALIGKFSLGATCMDAEGKTVRFFTNMQTMLEYMFIYRDEYRWFAHNGAGFDFRYFLVDKECFEWLIKKGYTVEIIGGSIPKAVAFKRFKKVILFCDSTKLLAGQSLKMLSNAFKVATPKGEIDFDKEDFDLSNPQHLLYLKHDVISLFQVVTKYRNVMIETLNQDIKCTLASTSFSAWRRTLDKNVFHHSKECNDFCRSAYYGARTEMYAQGQISGSGRKLDINSLYPYIMYNYGGLHRPYFTDKYMGAEIPGFYEIIAEVPVDYKFGPFAYKDKGLCFPVGRFATKAANTEIEQAIKMGCSVEVLRGCCFDEWDKDLFKVYIDKCKALRNTDYFGPIGIAAKYAQNNLYGFFGMNPNRESIIFDPEIPEGDYAPLIDPLSGEETPNIWIGNIYNDSMNCIPAFAAWITANARVKLLQDMLAEEKRGNIVLNCDTDSIFELGNIDGLDIGPDYGQWKIEQLIPEMGIVQISAKTYMLMKDDTNMDGPFKPDMKCKGIPARYLNPDMYYNTLKELNQIVTYPQLNSIKSVLKTGSMGRMATRTMPMIKSITSRIPQEDGTTSPRRLDII